MHDQSVGSTPLGPLQAPLWTFRQRHPASTAYLMPEVYFFDGVFDLDAATHALAETARRHESLRTTFATTAEGIVQIVHADPAHDPVEVLDLRHLVGAEQRERLEQAVSTASNTTFDLETRPGIALTAVLVSDTRTVLVLTGHQIACDGASMAIVVEEFGELYRAERESRTPDLPPLGPGYPAFVESQLGALASADAQDDLDHVAGQVSGATGSVLPGDRSTETETETGIDLSTHLVVTELPAGLAADVVAYAGQAGTPPFAVLMAAMSIMVTATTGDTDVCLGVSTSTRTPAWTRTVGMLANIVVPRSRVDLGASFAVTLAEVSLNLLDALDCRDVPFDRLETRWRTGSAPGAELVRTTFSTGAPGGLALGEGTVSERVSRSTEGPVRLAVVCEVGPAGISLDWQFALRAYSPQRARWYAEVYPQVLRALVTQPDTPVRAGGVPELMTLPSAP